MPSVENTPISLLVYKLYVINRVSDQYVTAAPSRPTGLRLSHVHDTVAESASKCFRFSLWLPGGRGKGTPYDGLYG